MPTQNTNVALPSLADFLRGARRDLHMSVVSTKPQLQISISNGYGREQNGILLEVVGDDVTVIGALPALPKREKGKRESVDLFSEDD